MKVLWFVNVPAGLENHYGLTNKSGFWLKKLAEETKDYTELHIAFYYTNHNGPFYLDGVYYHPMRYENYLNVTIKNRLNIGIVNDDDLENYLKLLDTINPDIIHIHGSENIFTSLIGKTNVPIVLSIQGIMTTISRFMYKSIERKYFSNFLQLHYTFSNFFFRQNRFFGKTSLEKAAIREQQNLKSLKYIIGRTDWDKYSSKILSPHAKYYHNDEILRDIFYISQWANPKNTETINLYSICSTAPYKGFELICETLALLSGFDVNVIWRVAGVSNDSRITSAVKKKLGSKYPKKNLILLGHQNEEDLVSGMLCSNIYVMPSHIENGCNALSEAMLLGMPCVSSLSGGTGTTVTNNLNGILLQNGDSFAFSGAILDLITNSEKALKIGLEARKTALLRHNPELIKKELLEIYKDILMENA